jgi:hypothetical protein
VKPGDLVQVRVPNGWVDYDSIDGQVGLLLEIRPMGRPIEYPVSVREQHDYIVLVGGRTLTLKKRILGRVRGDR